MAEKAKFKESKTFYMGNNKPQKLILPENKVISEENYDTFLAKQKERAEKEAEYKKQKAENLQKQFDEQYAEFIADDSYLNDYAKFNFLKSEVLIRVFRIVEKKLTNNVTEGGIYIPDEAQEGTTRISSYAKVIKLGNVSDDFRSKVKEGDIVKVTDHIMGVRPNPDYAELAAAYNERGTGVDVSKLPELKDIPMYVSNLSDWDQYNFRLIMIEYTDADALTYLVPQSFIYSTIDK
jgi:co-chaperonin GroES (HSP10)